MSSLGLAPLGLAPLGPTPLGLAPLGLLPAGLPAEWLPLVRLFFLLLAFAVTWAGVRLRRPRKLELQAALVAAGLQLVLAVCLDAAGQAAGLWRYAVSDGLVLGVPLDLHLGWALPWGVLFVLWAPRPLGAAAGYALLWWAVTVTYDALLAPQAQALVVRGAGPAWLLGDGVMIALLLAAALALYHAVRRSGEVRERGGPADAARRGAAWRAGLYLLVFGALSFGLLPHLILSLSGRSTWPLPAMSPALRWLILTYIGLCLLWPLWAVREFVAAGGTPLPLDPPLGLVVGGPYGFVRNPMQLGATAAMVGVAALYRSWELLAYAVDLVLLSQLLFQRHEETELRQRFGPAYEHYRAAVRCWLPRLYPYRAAAAPPLTLGYDAGCPACGEAVAWLQRRGGLPLIAQALPGPAAGFRVGEPQPRGGSVVHEGLDAWLALLPRGPLYLAWLTPLVLLPPVRALLRLCYRAAAERRPRA